MLFERIGEGEGRGEKRAMMIHGMVGNWNFCSFFFLHRRISHFVVYHGASDRQTKIIWLSLDFETASVRGKNHKKKKMITPNLVIKTKLRHYGIFSDSK